MTRRSPPWGAIEAFITAARVGSFRDAAAELALSPPAFSRRIQALERCLDVDLFDRRLPVPRLTSAGERYLRRLRPAHAAMREAMDGMAPDTARRPLRLGVSQSLAVSWLVPRLPRLYARNPGLELTLHTRRDPRELRGGGADLGIFFGRGDWPDLVCHELFGTKAFIVAAPGLVGATAEPRSLEALLAHPLLDLADPPDQWSAWLANAGYGGAIPRARLIFDGIQVMYEAAARGLGIALGVPPVVDGFLADGRLDVAFALTLPTGGAYYVAATPAMRRQPAVHALWRWLAEEAASSASA
jgi:LysR family glycine cleavage system transcriptional activator